MKFGLSSMSLFPSPLKGILRKASQAGFDFVKFEKIRDRNVKWKNRKHRVPLSEGILWVRG